MKYFGNKIKELRISRQYSAHELAKAIGKDGENNAQFIYDIESGKTKRVDFGILRELANVLGVTMEYLVNDEVNEPSKEKSVKIQDANSQDIYLKKYLDLLERHTELQEKCTHILEDKMKIERENMILKMDKLAVKN